MKKLYRILAVTTVTDKPHRPYVICPGTIIMTSTFAMMNGRRATT